ncbi:MAG TPA: ATP-binding protein [Candidatus Limnocylindria bacterium]|nr:ATP-binding protein [Candidatus Limnocylindria bacterium]
MAAIDPDPTDIVALDAAVIAERDRLAQVVDVLPVGIVLMDPAGRVTLENKLTRELFQRDERPAPGLGGRLAGTFSRADGSPYDLRDVPIARSLRGEEVRGERVRYTRADGRQYDLLTNSAPLRDSDGAIAGAISAYEDVTALSDAERERIAFFAMASHELKNPVTAVRGQIQLALRFLQRGSAEMVRGALERADEQTTRMAALIDDLLDAARLEVGRFDVIFAPTDLADVVAASVARLRPIAGDRVIRVDLPDQAVLVTADARRLSQVVDNLVVNGLRHGGAGDVVVSVSTQGGRALVRVRDHGAGIAAGDRQRIFERFYRAETARATPGTGLGLYVSREIARLHGGDLALESTGPAGTVFCVSLPLIATQ